MERREIIMSWWNGLSSLRKTEICDTNTELVGSVRRWETLTGREIEELFKTLAVDVIIIGVTFEGQAQAIKEIFADSEKKVIIVDRVSNRVSKVNPFDTTPSYQITRNREFEPIYIPSIKEVNSYHPFGKFFKRSRGKF